MRLRAQTIEQSFLFAGDRLGEPLKYGNGVRKSSLLSDELGNNKALHAVPARRMLVPLA
jgi:hypothetical protein